MKNVYKFTPADQARLNQLQKIRSEIEKEIADIYARTKCYLEFDRNDKTDCWIVNQLVDRGNFTDEQRQMLKNDFVYVEQQGG